MLTTSPQPTRQTNTAVAGSGQRRATIDVGPRMMDMERALSSGTDHRGQMEALATLRRWQFDPRLDSAARQRASALVWKFQPNGWDEV